MSCKSATQFATVTNMGALGRSLADDFCTGEFCKGAFRTGIDEVDSRTHHPRLEESLD